MGVMRYILGKPILGKNFIEYPTCKDVNLLAQFGLVKVIFKEKIKERLQISILDCNTNTLMYKQDGEPFLSSDIVIGKPYRIIFKSCVGGYVVYDTCSNKKQADESEADK